MGYSVVMHVVARYRQCDCFGYGREAQTVSQFIKKPGPEGRV